MIEAGKVAAEAAEAARLTGVVDRAQAAALELLGASDEPELTAAARRTLAGGLGLATRALAEHAGAAALRLEDADAAIDLDELGAELSRLLAEARRLQASLHDPARPSAPDSLYATDGFTEGVTAALRSLRQAADLLDDGEPADAAAFEVEAARDRLLGLL